MTDDCPFFRPSRPMSRDLGAVGVQSDLASVGIYCGLPGGRVRVPAPAEIKRYCVPGRFEDCPVYQRFAPVH